MPNTTPLHDSHARAGAVFVDDNGWQVPAHFGDPAQEHRQAVTQVVRADLGQRSRIDVFGPDAAIFLHNLCTNDTKSLAPGAGCEAFLCTNKARVVAHVRIARLPQERTPHIRLEAVAGQGPTILAHLNHYLISEQVELANATHDWTQLLMAGPAAKACLETLLTTPLDFPNAWHTVTTSARNSAVPLLLRTRDDLSVPSFDITCPRPAAQDIWDLLGQAGIPAAGTGTLDILRLEAGTPLFGRDIDDQRFVVEVDRAAQAICYTKGCYLGQEPIVMARDRGQVNRLLRGLAADGAEPLVAGAKVFQGETEVGQVTSSVFSPRLNRVIALAYLRRGAWDAGAEVTVFPPVQGRPAQVALLPFAAP